MAIKAGDTLPDVKLKEMGDGGPKDVSLGELAKGSAKRDAFVMGAWGKDQGCGGKVRMLADGNGELAKALGLELDASGFGMGKRSKRYAIIANDGKVEQVLVDESGLKESSADSVLSKL